MADEPKPVEKKWNELVKPLKDIEAGTPASFTIKKETVPIIFVPGIMGTRLKRGAKKIWDPDDKLFMLWNYGTFRTGPAEKKAAVVGDEFVPTDLEPYNDDPKHNTKFKAFEGADVRGWGTVAYGTYGEILQVLSNPETWPGAVNAFFNLPVYACGYNWGASNVDGGKALNKFIDDVIAAEKKQNDKWCEKVIIITHSMGGLVTRQAVQFGSQSKVLGVVHGVMPALGAAAAYWRMKAGFERSGALPNPAAWVLGTNGAEVTALLGWLPGGLQLLPGPKYTDNDGDKSWLHIADDEGNIKEKHPRGDAYSEIYLNEDENTYWRLVKKEYLRPDKNPRQSDALAWASYKEKVLSAKKFHLALGTYAHPETQVFYGAGKDHKTADRILYKLTPKNWRDSVWDAFKLGRKAVSTGRSIATSAMSGWGIAKLAIAVGGLAFDVIKKTEYWESRGGFKVKLETADGDIEVELQQADGAGDGTVPESSGKAVQQSGDAAGGKKAARAFSGIEHEPAYHADQRGMMKKAVDAVKGVIPGLDKYKLPEDNTVSFTTGSVHRMLAQKIKKARG